MTMKNEKIKEILKRKNGKVIISFCAVTVLAAAIIAAVAININLKPQKELILKHGTLEENVITASDTAERSSTSTNNINTSSSSASTTKTDQSPGTPKDKSSDAPKDQSPGTSKDKSNDAPKNEPFDKQKDKSNGAPKDKSSDKQKSKSNGTPKTGSSGSSSSTGVTADKYVRHDAIRYYTDEITGIKQAVHFMYVEFANEVGGGYADINTTAEMGEAHHGDAVAILSGSNGRTITDNNAFVSRDGNNGVLIFDNLKPGTYEIKLVAKDGTVVAKYHFTVKERGKV